MRRPRMLMHAHMHRLQHKLGRSVAALGGWNGCLPRRKTGWLRPENYSTIWFFQTDTGRPQQTRRTGSTGKRNRMETGWLCGRCGVHTKDKIADTAGQLREQAKDLPVNAKYALYHGKTQVSEGVRDFTSSVTQTRTARAEQRNAQAESRRQTIAERRAELEQAKQPQKTPSPQRALLSIERPVTAKQPEDFRNRADTAHTEKPAMQPASPSIGNGDKFLMGGTVAERASVPMVKTASIHHEQTPPIRTERQIVPSASPIPSR